jgi:hypothetical protein
MNTFELSRNWFNFGYENPDLIKPIHSAIYFFAIDHCNRMGNKEKFGFPTTMAMEAIGVKSYHTFIEAFNNLVDWKFIELIEKSKNQYSANIIAISKNDKALNKALDKALSMHASKHTSKQSQSTVQSIDSIIKQTNKQTNKQETIDEIYMAYPSKCPIQKRSTGKCSKDKERIEKLLNSKTKEEILKTIELYIQDCIKTNTFVKNYSTFLNNPPDLSELAKDTKPISTNFQRSNNPHDDPRFAFGVPKHMIEIFHKEYPQYELF